MEDAISNHPLWKEASEEEFEGACEGMEKYICTKIYDWYYIVIVA
jgi:hypothetical protein